MTGRLRLRWKVGRVASRPFKKRGMHAPVPLLSSSGSIDGN